LTLALFGIAGIFSSEVTKAVGSEALIRGPNCGFWNFPIVNVTQNEAWQSKVL
jgi:hypothetical protein